MKKPSVVILVILAIAIILACIVTMKRADAQARAAFTKHKPDLVLAMDAKDLAFVDFLESPGLGLSQGELTAIENYLIPEATNRQMLQAELNVRRAYRRMGFAPDSERVMECESEIARLQAIVDAESVEPE